MYFSAGDGAGIAVAKSISKHPQGLYKDFLGKPLIKDVLHGGQPIDPVVFIDDDECAYLLWGG